MSAKAPTEAELILKGEEQARERLAEAEARVKKSSFLPAGNETRDADVEELHDAQAQAAEWCV